MLKHLREIHLETVNMGLGDRLTHYRLTVVNLPDKDYLKEQAWLHIEREDTSAHEALRTLREAIAQHNRKVDSAQSKIMKQARDEFANHQLTYDAAEGVLNNPLWDNVLEALFSVWQANEGELVKSHDQARLLDYFTRLYAWNYENGRLWIVKGMSESSTTSKAVWRGSEEGKENAMDAIRAVLVDSIILGTLGELENSKSSLVDSVNKIREVATRINEAIEADCYTARAKCCPTVFRLIRNYFF